MLFYLIIILIGAGILVLALKKPFLTLLIFLFLLPLNAFIITYGKHLFVLGSTQKLVLTLWKDWLVICLLFWSILKIIKDKVRFKFFWFDYLIIFLFLLALLTIIWGSKDLKTIIFGLRYDFEFFALYFIGRVFRPSIKELKIILSVVLISGLIVTIFGILQATVLPWDFLNRFGYTYAYEWLPGADLQSSQIVGSTRDLSRIISTLSGPNQLGSYLSLISVFLLVITLFAQKISYKIYSGLFFLAALLPFYRTYSRSAWLGLVFTILVLLIYIASKILFLKKSAPKNFYITLSSIIILVLIAASSFIYLNSINPGLLREVFSRSFSTSNHLNALKKGTELLLKHPAGTGIGTAGPASQWSLGVDQAVITESNFLQLGVEMGFLGFVSFIVIIIALIVKLFKEIDQNRETITKIMLLGSALGLIALSINALFLHSFADTATSFTLFALIGLALTKPDHQEVKASG